MADWLPSFSAISQAKVLSCKLTICKQDGESQSLVGQDAFSLCICIYFVCCCSFYLKGASN